MVQQTLAVSLVLVLLIATLWFLRRKGLARVNLALAGRRSAAKQVQVVERISLTASHSLYLIRVDNRMILVGVSPASCQALHSFAATPPPAEPVKECRSASL